jgi:CRP-like cAMP-binding protein
MPALHRSLIQSLPLFGAMQPAELDEVIANATALRIPNGDFPLSRQDIAEATGTTLHSVSRVLSAWENAGLVLLGRRKVIVCDIERLGRIAEGGAAVPPES